MVHGYTGNAFGNWYANGIMQASAKNHQVMALDCRNHGRGDKPQPGGPGQVSDVVELMDHLMIFRGRQQAALRHQQYDARWAQHGPYADHGYVKSRTDGSGTCHYAGPRGTGHATGGLWFFLGADLSTRALEQDRGSD